MIKLAIIDDHPIVRRGLMDVFAQDTAITIVANIGDASFAIAKMEETEPDIALLNLHMPGQGGIALLRQLKSSGCVARIVVFSSSNSNNDIHQAIRAGADGYLLKDIEPDLLVASVKRCMTGEPVFSDSIKASVLQANQSKAPEGRHPVISELTDRELDVLHLIAEGLTNKDIGNRLAIAEGTVKVHVKRLLAKLNLRSRVEAAIFALEHTENI
ncbi:response regulator [Reinekea forsetii]|nr:response regulator [Reinekea forsetii]